ncbi:putative death-receptor fusion protein-domain-containing protein [Kalaharituber pfeilii]|nr:putative death-receptor fusion protein-domain-containing protein [Kalaharituber pfeilii]
MARVAAVPTVASMPSLSSFQQLFEKAGVLKDVDGEQAVQPQTPPPIVNPLDIELLKEVRAHLVSLQTARGGGNVTVSKMEEKRMAGTNREPALYSPNAPKDAAAIHSLFAKVLNTAALPSLSNPHRTVACDVLSTWLIRASSPPHSCTPAIESNLALLRVPFSAARDTTAAGAAAATLHRLKTFAAITNLLLSNFDSSASSALIKALKDLFNTLLGSYKVLFLQSLPSTTLQKDDIYLTYLQNQTLALLGLGPGYDSTLTTDALPQLRVTAGLSESRRKAAYFIIETLVTRKPGTGASMGGSISARNLLKLADGERKESDSHQILLHLLSTVSKDRTLASSAGKTFVSILAGIKSELVQERESVEGEALARWENIWNEPLRAALRGSFWGGAWGRHGSAATSDGETAKLKAMMAAARVNLTTYVLPGVFRLSGVDGLRRFVEGFRLHGRQMQKDETVEDWDVDAWLCCIRVGREVGFVDEIDDVETTSRSPTLTLSKATLIPLLTHTSTQTRLSALSLLMASPVTTKPPSSASLALLRSHLSHFHASTDAEFRNITAGLIRAFIERLAGASFATSRKAQKMREKSARGLSLSEEELNEVRSLEERVEEMKDFVEWYIGFIRQQMYPGKGFPRVTMAMRVLRMWVNSGVDMVPPLKREPPDPHSKSKSKNQSRRNPRTGPQGSDIQFPFRVTIFDDETKEGAQLSRLLLDSIFNSFEDIRSEAAEIVKSGLISRNKGRNIIDSRFLFRCLGRVQRSGRARDADGLGRALEILYEAIVTWGSFTVSRPHDRTVVDRDPSDLSEITLSSPLEYMQYLVNTVLRGRFLHRIKSGGISEGVKGWAIHGIISGIRLILERKGLYNLISISDESRKSAWKLLHKQLIETCFELWEIVGPLLCADAPEGYLPDFDDGDEEDEEFGIGGDATAQALMSYSWRAIKESSALLSTIIFRAPAPEILSGDDIKKSGELVIEQLANIRHRGAFAAVSPSLIQICQKCFEVPNTQKLPRTWLMENFSLIMTKAVSVTRRSAGIPYLIIGILAAELDQKRPLLFETFARFVNIAKMSPKESMLQSKVGEDNGGTKLDLPQVHALNCIKLLFSDSRLGPIVSDLIGPGLEVSVSCFASPIWAIRNGGLMLFTALLNRIFGTRKSRNDYSYTAKLFTTKRFFSKYPAVKDVLLSHLKTGVEVLRSPSVSLLSSSSVPIVEMVYPALSLISRLGVSPGYNGIEAFRPLIIECMRSKVWKVREVAAKAYVSLVSPEECIPEIKRLLHVEGNQSKQNSLHGSLCTVKCLLERRVGQILPPEERESPKLQHVAAETCEALNDMFETLAINNRCLMTKALFLEITGIVALNFEGTFTPSLGVFARNSIGVVEAATIPLRLTLSEFATQDTILADTFAGAKIVGNAESRAQLARILAQLAIMEGPESGKVEDVISLLAGPEDEITVTISTVLMEYSGHLNWAEEKIAHVKSILWRKAIDDSNWCEVRVACMELLGVILEHHPRIVLHDDKVLDWEILLDLIVNARTVPLKDASLVALGKVVFQIWSTENADRQRPLKLWLEQVVSASHENMPYPSRESALQSLEGISSVLQFSSSAPESSLLPVYFTLYNFLNDDEEEIRESAATIVTREVLKVRCPMIPLAASEALARKLGEEFQGSVILPAVAKIVGQQDIKTILADVSKNNEILFMKEKQNLWIDEIREVDLWTVVLETVLSIEKNSEQARAGIERLIEFVKNGLDDLLNYGLSMEGKENTGNGTDGPLGWTSSSEEVFASGWRVFNGLGILKKLRESEFWSTAEIDSRKCVWEEILESERKLEGKVGLWRRS